MPALVILLGAACFPFSTAFGVFVLFPVFMLAALVLAVLKLGMARLMGVGEEPPTEAPRTAARIEPHLGR